MNHSQAKQIAFEHGLELVNDKDLAGNFVWFLADKPLAQSLTDFSDESLRDICREANSVDSVDFSIESIWNSNVDF